MKIKLLIITCLLPFSGFCQNDGDAFFGSNQVHTINITFSQPSFWDSLVANYAIDEYMRGDVEIDGTILANSAVQLKGNSSYNSYPGKKKSMNLDFNNYVAGQDYDGLSKLNLNNCFKDPTLMREKVFLDFCQKAGIPAPRCTYAKVFINGAYWGLYSVVEQVNKSFCGIRFIDNDGNLFKGDPHGTLEWKGASASLYYNDYELKTNETENDWSDLVHLLNIINNNGTGAAFIDSLQSILDLDSYFKSWAVSNIFANLDSYVGSGHNYYIYHDSVDFKFHWITWDVNEAFGNFNQGMNLSQIKDLDIFYIPQPQPARPLNYNILQNATLKQQYVEAVCDLATNYFVTSYLTPLIDSLTYAIRSDVYADTMKMFTNQNFEDNINSDINISGLPGGGDIAGLKQFITERRASLMTQLASWGCYLGTEDQSGSDFNVNVFPNPAAEIIQVNLNSGFESLPIPYTLSDITGRVILKGEINEDDFVIHCSDINEGSYILNLGNKIYKKILVVR